jgi:hypothetical protein
MYRVDRRDGREDRTMTTELQYQLSNGNWTNCGADREQYFLDLAIRKSVEMTTRIGAERLSRFDRHLASVVDTATALAVLRTGLELPTGDGWPNTLRIKPAPRPVPTPDPRPMLRCRCGNTGYAGAYPFSTLPGSGRCDDCV